MESDRAGSGAPPEPRRTHQPAPPSDPDGVTAQQVPDLLLRHLEQWAGWPPDWPFRVVGNPRRGRPGWDGQVWPVTGVVTERDAAVVALTPETAAGVAAAQGPTSLPELLGALPELLGTPGRAGLGSFRWSVRPAPGPDDGIWVPVTDPRVPPWLHPFGSPVLIAVQDGGYAAGVGIKRHDRFGHELAVVTHERARGHGLARRLVAQAARRVLAEGAIPTYLHGPDNQASARVAEAAGFADRGWQVIGFFSRPPG